MLFRSDLLFIVDDSDVPGIDNYWHRQNGFRHVAFCSAPGQNFGANDFPDKIGASPIDGFASHGAPFNRALSLAGINPAKG